MLWWLESRENEASGDTVALRNDSTQPLEAEDINAEITNEPIKTIETETVTKTVDNVVEQIVKEAVPQTETIDCCYTMVQKDYNKCEPLQKEIDELKSELQLLKKRHGQSRTVFDIDDFQGNGIDISFYTGFQNYGTLKLCFRILEPNLGNINYGKYKKCNDPDNPGRPRKLSKWQGFIMVLMRIRLGLFARDLAHRFDISESTVSTLFRAWVKF